MASMVPAAKAASNSSASVVSSNSMRCGPGSLRGGAAVSSN
jgi:hypothetical protein